MSKFTQITTTTNAISTIFDGIIKDASAASKLPSKQRMLNTAARVICGDKHDWGFLTGHEGPVVQKGLADQPHDKKYKSSKHQKWNIDPKQDAVIIEADKWPFSNPGNRHDHLATLLKGDLMCVAEEFYKDYDDNIECMFDPKAILFDADAGCTEHELWNASSEIINSAGSAYFAASANLTFGFLVNNAIEKWDGNEGPNFVAFYFPNFLVVSVKDPKSEFEERLSDLSSEHDAFSDKTLARNIIQVIIDSDLNESQIEEARQDAQDFVLRYAKSQQFPDAICTRVAVQLPERAPTHNKIEVVSHILTDTVHGGFDDAPGVSFWIDLSNNVAHLSGHSGSHIPLDGPIAPQKVPYYKEFGPVGHYTTFSKEEIQHALAQLEDVLLGMEANVEDLHTDLRIETILNELIGDTYIYDLHLE